MINPDHRLFVGGGGLYAAGPYTCEITDLDQRRLFNVVYDPGVEIEDEQELENTYNLCRAELQKHIDHLEQGVYGFSFTTPDGPIKKLTHPNDDLTLCTNYPLLSALKVSFPLKTLHLSKLRELDRLGPEVDLVSYQDAPTVTVRDGEARGTTAVFKYSCVQNTFHMTWRELQIWSALPRDHPNIVPFDSVILDDVSGGIVGFTSVFVPGGTLEDTATTRTFRLPWLRQLLKVVDELNYHYGIFHKDIAPRNLLIDGENLQLFDFNFAGTSTTGGNQGAQVDASGAVRTLYEIITLDRQYRKFWLQDLDFEAVMGQEWVKHPDVKLDSGVQDLKDVLGQWLAERKGRDLTPQTTWIRWPTRDAEHPPIPVPNINREGEITEITMQPTSLLTRRNWVKMGKPFFNWERPASYNLKEHLGKKAKQ